MSIFYKFLRQPNTEPLDADADEAAMRPSGVINSDIDNATGLMSDVPLAFLRLCRFNDGAIEQLGRYEIALWRQTVQILVLFRSRQRRDSRITNSE